MGEGKDTRQVAWCLQSGSEEKVPKKKEVSLKLEKDVDVKAREDANVKRKIVNNSANVPRPNAIFGIPNMEGTRARKSELQKRKVRPGGGTNWQVRRWYEKMGHRFGIYTEMKLRML